VETFCGIFKKIPQNFSFCGKKFHKTIPQNANYGISKKIVLVWILPCWVFQDTGVLGYPTRQN
jgi:hypothetical protein